MTKERLVEEQAVHGSVVTSPILSKAPQARREIPASAFHPQVIHTAKIARRRTAGMATWSV